MKMTLEEQKSWAFALANDIIARFPFVDRMIELEEDDKHIELLQRFFKIFDGKIFYYQCDLNQDNPKVEYQAYINYEVHKISIEFDNELRIIYTYEMSDYYNNLRNYAR